jgi:hypothetical protein
VGNTDGERPASKKPHRSSRAIIILYLNLCVHFTYRLTIMAFRTAEQRNEYLLRTGDLMFNTIQLCDKQLALIEKLQVLLEAHLDQENVDTATIQSLSTAIKDCAAGTHSLNQIK